MRTQVAIIGAGPAGLMLARLLQIEGIEAVVLEARSREHVEQRIRAGVLEQGTVDLLAASGVGERMQREGLVHHGIELQFEGERHRIPLSDLAGGRSIVVYGQTEVVKDLIAARLASGAPLLFEVEDVSVHDLESEHPQGALPARGPRRGPRVRRHRGLRRLSRGVPREHSRSGAAHLRARVPVRLAGDPGRRRAVVRRAHLRPPRARLRAAQPALARAEQALRAVPAGRGHRGLVRRAHLGGAADSGSASTAGRWPRARCWRRA